MRCPRCGSETISSIIDTKTHTRTTNICNDCGYRF